MRFKFVENQMFLITVLFYILFHTTHHHYFAMGSWELNRTAGWGWEKPIQYWLQFFGAFFIFAIAYGILKLLKRKTNYRLSIGHILAMLAYTFMHNVFIINDFAFILVGIFMWGFFVANLIKSKKIARTN